MSPTQKICQVCGRNLDQLQKLREDIELKTELDIPRCTKCLNEYQRELKTEEKETGLEKEEIRNSDWKKLAVA